MHNTAPGKRKRSAPAPWMLVPMAAPYTTLYRFPLTLDEFVVYERRPELGIRARRSHALSRDHGLGSGGGAPLGPRDLDDVVEGQEAEDRLVALDQEAAPPTGQDVLVYQLLQGDVGWHREAFAAHDLGHPVAPPQILQHHL